MNSSLLSFSYFKISKNLFYSLIFISPMIFLYELLCFYQFYNEEYIIRNGADIFLRNFFISFGSYSNILYAVFLFITLLIIFLYNKKIVSLGVIKVKYLILMFLESIFWTIIFLPFMLYFEKIILSIISSQSILETYYLSIGAGIWEEILFRFMLISLFNYVLLKLFKTSQFITNICSILISASIFSLFHYIGPYGDLFTYKTFCIRFIAGIYLGTIYIFRGLGIVSYVHIFYDISIATIPLIYEV